jgi:HD superfamily phosphohydrolase
MAPTARKPSRAGAVSQLTLFNPEFLAGKGSATAGRGGRHIPTKAVSVPLSAPVSISDFLPLVDHPLFQKLRKRKQLGVNYLVFPGAVHTRFEHAIGVLGWTQRLCQIYSIQGRERHELCAYALLHDIGHGPFSHQIEPVIDGDHNEQGCLRLREMESALARCGLSRPALERLFTGENPLRQLVSDRNLGTDKLDYLVRDSLHIGFTGAPDIEKVVMFSFIEHGVWAVEEKVLEDVKCIQKFYSYLHQHGYLNKTALSIQRVFQRAVQEQLRQGTLSTEAVWQMTDAECEAWLNQGGSRLARRLMRSLDDRTFHRTVYVIKPRGYGFVERTSTKNITVREWSRDQIRRFSEQYGDCAALLQLEDELAAVLGLAAGDILLAAMPYFAKLLPCDVRIFSSRGEGSYWLFENDRDHIRSLEGDYLRTFAIRFMAPPNIRDSVARKAAAITEFLRAKMPAAEDGD